MLALFILVPLYLSTAIVVCVRAWRWRSDLSPRFRRCIFLPIAGVITSFLFSLSNLFRRSMFLAFFSFFFHRLTGVLAVFVFIYLIRQSLGFCNVSQHRYKRVTNGLQLVGAFIAFSVGFQTMIVTSNRISRGYGFDNMSSQMSNDLVDYSSLRHNAMEPASSLTLYSGENFEAVEVDPEVFAEVLRELEPSLSIEDVEELQNTGHVEYTQPDHHVDLPSPDPQVQTRARRNQSSDIPWPFYTVVDFAIWISLAVKVALVVIASILKQTDSRDQGVNKELMSWLLCGSVVVLIQDPKFMLLCFHFTWRMRMVESFLDPLLFVLMQESIIGVGYWNVDETLDAEEAARYEESSQLARMFGFRVISPFGRIRLR